MSNTITIQTTNTGSQISISKIIEIQNELTLDLNNLKDSVKLKDSEIKPLTQEISNLQTIAQTESLKTELTNLKISSSKRK